jgi:hypothetical protein
MTSNQLVLERERDRERTSQQEETSPEEGACVVFVTNCHQRVVCGGMEAAGIAPAEPVPQVISQHDICVEQGCRWLHYGCTEASLIELLASWPNLPPHIIQAIMALVRTSQPGR